MPRSRRPILAPPDGVFPSTHAQRIGRRWHLRPGRARVRHHLQIERRLEFRAGRIPHAGRLCFAHHHDRREGPVCSGVCLDATLLGGAWPADGARGAAAAARAADHLGHHGYARPLQRAKAVVQGIWGTDTRPFPAVFPTDPVMLGPLPVSLGYLWSLGCVAVLLVLLNLFFRKTRLGLAMRATASSQQVALSMGISVQRIFALAWVIAAAV